MIRAGKFLVLFMAVLRSSAQNGVLEGVIQDGTGLPIHKAYVTLQQRPPADRPYGSHTETDAKGLYRFTGIPAGIFQICAVVVGSDFLSPCVSMSQAARSFVTVGPGATVTAPAQRLVKGVRIRVKVEDAGGVLTAASREVSSERPFLSLQIQPPDYPSIPLTVAASTPSEYVYEALVPNTTARLQVFSRKLNVSTGGAPLSAQTVSPEITPRSGGAPLMILRIDGRRN